jgi:hypothetical protein
LIGRLKIFIVGLSILAILAGGVFLYALLNKHKHISLENRQLAFQVSTLKHRLKISQDHATRVMERKKLYTKDSEEPFENTPPDCKTCFESAEMEIELEDEKGWWKYHDKNTFDEEPGTFELTEIFWEEVLPPTVEESGQPEIFTPTKESWKRIRRTSQKALQASMGLSGYEMEFSYSPFGLNGKNWSLELALASRISTQRISRLNRLSQNPLDPASLKADLGLSLTLRW